MIVSAQNVAEITINGLVCEIDSFNTYNVKHVGFGYVNTFYPVHLRVFDWGEVVHEDTLITIKGHSFDVVSEVDSSWKSHRLDVAKFSAEVFTSRNHIERKLSVTCYTGCSEISIGAIDGLRHDFELVVVLNQVTIDFMVAMFK